MVALIGIDGAIAGAIAAVEMCFRQEELLELGEPDLQNTARRLKAQATRGSFSSLIFFLTILIITGIMVL